MDGHVYKIQQINREFCPREKTKRKSVKNFGALVRTEKKAKLSIFSLLLFTFVFSNEKKKITLVSVFRTKRTESF